MKVKNHCIKQRVIGIKVPFRDVCVRTRFIRTLDVNTDLYCHGVNENEVQNHNTCKSQHDCALVFKINNSR